VLRKGALCEKCKDTDGQKAAIPEKQGRDRVRDRRRFEAKASSEIRALRKEFVLELYLRRGPFWEAVQELRVRRNIEPSMHLPPKHLLLPLSPPSLVQQRDKVETEQQHEEWEEDNGLWRADLLSIILKVVPERFCARHSFNPAHDWYGFVSS
jgi:hypothetical protein